ncbi:MAG TPA: hypothetical protein VKZ60_07570 [Chloroflexota bacterium]|nr:hypothetical protein [Chloroflexota bacterium]
MELPVLVSPWIALALGLALAFGGRALVLLQIRLFGALLGALAALAVATSLAGPGPSDDLLRLAALGLGALIGWGLADALRRVAVFVLGAAVGAGALGRLLPPDVLAPPLAGLVGAVLGGLLLVTLESPLLKLATAALGGLVVAGAAAALLPPPPGALPWLCGLAAAVLGAGAQLVRG